MPCSLFSTPLLAETEKRRTEATLQAQVLHHKVYDLDGKKGAVDLSSNLLDSLDRELSSEPTTPEFKEAVAAVSAAMEELRQTHAAVDPELAGLHQRIAAVRTELQAPTPPPPWPNTSAWPRSWLSCRPSVPTSNIVTDALTMAWFRRPPPNRV